MTMPLVSVIMPTYNTPEPFLRSAIKSILAQTYNAFELIIIDDGSVYDVFEITKSYNDERTKIYKNDKNRGLPYSLNRAIALSKGEYLARMDSDDVSLPNRLEEMVRFLEKNKDIDIAGCYYKEFGNTRRISKLVTDNDLIRPTMLFICPFCHPSIVFRKSSIEKFNIKYSNEEKSEDYNLWVECSFNKEIIFANLNRVLIKYRIHEQQITIKKKDEFKIHAVNIRKKIFDYLEINLNKKELDIYMRFCLANGIMTVSDFKVVDKIFQKIIIANKKIQLYKSQSLRQVLANKYRKEYIRRNYLYRQKCGKAFKTFSLRKYATPLFLDITSLVLLNIKYSLLR